MVLIEEMGATEPDTARALKLKEGGNKLFQDREFTSAAELYSESLAALGPNPAPGEARELAAVICSNRAACSLQLKAWPAAADDARRALALEPGNAKAHRRLATALKKQGDAAGALAALEAGISALEAAGSGADATLLRSDLRALVAAGQSKVAPAASTAGAARATPKGARTKATESGGFLNKAGGGGIFGDTPPPQTEAERVLASLRATVEAASRGLGVAPGQASGQVLEQGLLAKLLDKSYFCATVFPGLSAAQRSSAPASLKELLADPVYSRALETEAVRCGRACVCLQRQRKSVRVRERLCV